MAALAGICASATGAFAQYVYGYARAYPAPRYEDAPMVPPRAVVYRLQDRGFTEIARPRFDGTAYSVDATNPAGARVRLFVDAQDGAVIGRQRLDAPYAPPRIARAAPGYGWTEEDMAPRRSARRDEEPLLPPGDIPLPRPSLRSEPDRLPPPPPPRPGVTANAAPDGAGAPFGVNPDAKGARDAKGRAAAPPRKTAKLTPPAKPAPPRASPEAPAPQAVPPAPAPDAVKAAPETAPETTDGKAESAPLTPAANQPAAEKPATEKPAEPQSAEKPAPEQPAADKPAAEKAAADADGPSPNQASNQGSGQTWQDPPEAKRNVRVIGGATVVPGGGEPAPAGAN